MKGRYISYLVFSNAGPDALIRVDRKTCVIVNVNGRFTWRYDRLFGTQWWMKRVILDLLNEMQRAQWIELVRVKETKNMWYNYNKHVGITVKIVLQYWYQQFSIWTHIIYPYIYLSLLSTPWMIRIVLELVITTIPSNKRSWPQWREDRGQRAKVSEDGQESRIPRLIGACGFEGEAWSHSAGRSVSFLPPP